MKCEMDSGQVILQGTRTPLLIATMDTKLGILLLNKLGIVLALRIVDALACMHGQKGKRHTVGKVGKK